MGEESNGIGVQYLFLDQPTQTAHSIALGFSLEQKADVTFSYSNSKISTTGDRSVYESETGSIQMTFFPAREENEEDLFTGEFLTGFGFIDIGSSNGFTFLLGTGISKALFKNEDGNNLRPRLSAGYALSTLKNKSQSSTYDYMSPEQTQVGIGISFSAELTADLRFNDTAGLLLSSGMFFFPGASETGIGYSVSFIF
ncbi:MAG: hypothetical protein R6V27_03945 [Balneolaceae bacterium]